MAPGPLLAVGMGNPLSWPMTLSVPMVLELNSVNQRRPLPAVVIPDGWLPTPRGNSLTVCACPMAANA